MSETPYAGDRPVRRAGAPLAAGTSTAGDVIVDPAMPPTLKLKSGRIADVLKSTAHHESRERRLMDAGKPYDEAHDDAECYENHELEAEQGLSPGDVKSYEQRIRPFVHSAEHRHAMPTPDLDPRVRGHGALAALAKVAAPLRQTMPAMKNPGFKPPWGKAIGGGMMAPPTVPKPAATPAQPPAGASQLPSYLQHPLVQPAGLANTTTGSIARTQDSMRRRAEQFSAEANASHQQFHGAQMNPKTAMAARIGDALAALTKTAAAMPKSQMAPRPQVPPRALPPAPFQAPPPPALQSGGAATPPPPPARVAPPMPATPQRGAILAQPAHTVSAAAAGRPAQDLAARLGSQGMPAAIPARSPVSAANAFDDAAADGERAVTPAPRLEMPGAQASEAQWRAYLAQQ